jgi:hypothetical protein
MTVLTKVHRILELVDDHDVRLSALPHYVIDHSLVEIMGRDDIQSSLAAMIEAEIARLPFSPMIVEFSIKAGVVRVVRLEETLEGFDAEVTTVKEGLIDVAPPVGLKLSTTGLYSTVNSSMNEGSAAILALCMALLLLNTRGVDKEVVHCAALNKQREKRKLPLIPRYSHVKIGMIYRADGTTQSYGVGHHKCVHWRSGYVKEVPHGPARSLRKKMYIPPCLVNFQTGDTAPIPMKRVAL